MWRPVEALFRIDSNSLVCPALSARTLIECLGWKKRNLKLRTNGDLEYYHNSKLRGSFSMLGSAVILDRKDPCRFEIDTGRGIWHLRSPWATDREVWVKNFQSIGAPSKSEDTVVAKLEARIDTLNKNIALARSLEAVLISRVEVIKSESKSTLGHASLDVSTENAGAVVLEESGEHHKKKKKGHSRQKSEALDGGSGSFLLQTQEVQRTVAQLIASIEEISTELSDTVAKLDKALREARESNGSGSGAAHTGSGKTGSSDDEAKDAAEPIILYNEEDSGSDSEDYFDADDMDFADGDDSSSSMEYFEQSPPPQHAKRKTKDATIRDSNQSAGSGSSFAAATASTPPESSSSGAVSGSNANTPAKKTKSSKSKRRLSRSFNEEGRQASLKIKLKPSGVVVADTIEQIPDEWAPRKALPQDKPKAQSLPLMKILKDAVGKDISRITIPVSFSEPINMLQRMVEDFEYGEILLKGTTLFIKVLHFSSFLGKFLCTMMLTFCSFLP